MAIFTPNYIQNLNESYIDYYNKAKSKLEIFFQHAVIWKHKPEIQHRDWVDSIIDNAKESEKELKGNTNATNMLQTNLESIYYIALKREKFLRYNKDINDNGEVYNIFNNLNEKI